MIKQDLPQFNDLIRTPDNKLAMRLFVYWGPVYVVPDHQIRSMSPKNVFGILTIYRVLPIVFLVMFCEFFGFSRVISTLFYPVAFLLGHSISVFRVCEGHRLTDTADCLELSSFERNYLAFLGSQRRIKYTLVIFILVFLILIATYSGGGLNYHLLMIVGFGILIASDVHKIFVGRRDPPQGLSEKLAEMKQINMIIQQRIQEHEQKKANSEISMEHNTVQPDTKPISNADKSGVQQIF